MAARLSLRRLARPLSTASSALKLHTRMLDGPAGAAEPPLLVLHGLFGQGGNFQSVGRKLAAGRSVVLADLRNHGASPWDADASLSAMADDVAALISSLGAPAVSLCGHSLGGKVAMLVALRRPELVARLCVVDIAPVAYEMGGNRAILDALLALPDAALASRAAADAALAAAAAAPQAEALGNQFIRQFLLQNLVPDERRWRLNLRALRDGYDALRGFPDAGAPAAGLPTLFIGGERDGMLGEEHRDACVAHFPDARLEMLPVGHFVHSEAPGPFVELVDDFCKA